VAVFAVIEKNQSRFSGGISEIFRHLGPPRGWNLFALVKLTFDAAEGNLIPGSGIGEAHGKYHL
jgi:hypothetical protein